jgi:transcriptional regulator with XRE-family HTH domain
MTAEIGKRVAYFRKRATPPDGKKLTVQALADRCSRLGLPLGRVTIAKLETGLRQTITPAEVLVLAAALEVSPVELLLPIGREPDAEMLPGHRIGTWEALQWFDGELKLARESAEQGAMTLLFARRGEETDVEILRRHQAYVHEWEDRRRHPVFGDPEEMDAAALERRRASLQPIEELLRVTRAEMVRRGMLLPDLPENLDLGESEGGG